MVDMIPSKHQLLSMPKESLAELTIKLSTELSDYKYGMIDKREAAQQFKTSIETINRYMRDGKLPFKKADPEKPNSSVRFLISDLMRCFGKKNE